MSPYMNWMITLKSDTHVSIMVQDSVFLVLVIILLGLRKVSLRSLMVTTKQGQCGLSPNIPFSDRGI